MDSFEKRFYVHYYADLDSITDECVAFDQEHFKALKKIIGDSGWPKSSEIGERATYSAFLILSHSNDSSAMAQYLPIIENRCSEGEAEWKHYIMLYDRLQVMRNLPQRFGTQYKPPKSPDENLELFPLENPDKVNEWRKRFGIEPLILED